MTSMSKKNDGCHSLCTTVEVNKSRTKIQSFYPIRDAMLLLWILIMPLTLIQFTILYYSIVTEFFFLKKRKKVFVFYKLLFFLVKNIVTLGKLRKDCSYFVVQSFLSLFVTENFIYKGFIHKSQAANEKGPNKRGKKYIRRIL